MLEQRRDTLRLVRIEQRKQGIRQLFRFRGNRWQPVATFQERMVREGSPRAASPARSRIAARSRQSGREAVAASRRSYASRALPSPAPVQGLDSAERRADLRADGPALTPPTTCGFEGRVDDTPCR